VFQLPKEVSYMFPTFFEKFDRPSVQQDLGIKDYTVSVGSLEEVFLKVGEEDEIDGSQAH
jgi:hypothetical protein